MAPIRYSLHYEDYSEHLMSRFGKLLQMQSLVDMTLMCSSHTLRVHKAVLAASSAYFQEVLQKQMGEPLIILKMRFNVLKCLVEFMYCGKTQCLEENLDELVSAAQFLKIKGLSKVTKEGLGIANSGELPVFTPPVVINRPPQSLINQHSQENNEIKAAHPQSTPAISTNQPVDSFGRPPKHDTVVRIPFDIENGGSSSNVDYPELPRSMKPRRGRPSVRHRSAGWEGPGSLSRAAERALLRREQDSRKAIHQLKHLQTRHIQDYMDRVTLSQAVNSICGPETSNSYMNMNNDLMYMDQNVTSNVLAPNIPFKNSMPDNIPSSYSNTSTTNSINDSNGDGIGTAMSQYVNALKSAGLPTDLPILFESGDGSYINVNEQVLLDMVQSSEIQYEVIEQPNIIEKVADPSEIKSIDDLSKSIERGEMLMNNKSYTQSDYKDPTQFDRAEDAINSLNTILPDNLESFGDQQNYVVLDRLQENNHSLDVIDHVNTNDYSCIDGDMQFFTKSMSDDVKKYYEDQQLSDARVMGQLCPTSSSLENNFNMSLLDAKSSQMNETLNQQFSTLNSEAMRRSEDCYDFSLQLPQSNVFKDDLDCLISTPRRNDDDGSSFIQAKEEIIKDLMSIESKMNMSQQINATSDNTDMLNTGNHSKSSTQTVNSNTDMSASITTSGLHWDGLDMNDEPCKDDDEDNNSAMNNNTDEDETPESRFHKSVMGLNRSPNAETETWDSIIQDSDAENNENEPPKTNDEIINSDLDTDIPYAVGLLPLKQAQLTDDSSHGDSSPLKRKHSVGPGLLESVDAKCLKRKAKKKL